MFDRYEDAPSLKGNTHFRHGKTGHATVHVRADAAFASKRDNFLGNTSNKDQIIKLIMQKLRKHGCFVNQAEHDANFSIVLAAVDRSRQCSRTLIGEDTDLLLLLLYYADCKAKTLIFRPDKKNCRNVYDIHVIKTELGPEVCRYLLFTHAFTLSDTTPRIFNVGKQTVFGKLKDPAIINAAKNFTTPGLDKNLICEYGLKAMVIVSRGKLNVELMQLRYNVLVNKILAAKRSVSPERLPPTESATNYHSMRTYLQTMIWMGTSGVMDPREWGWKVEGGKYIPLLTDNPAAPEFLLNIIPCPCKIGCASKRCRCVKHGLPSTEACEQCQLEGSCVNYEKTVQPEEDI